MGKSPRIIFMGTPDFAVATLNAVITDNYNVVGVITAPDKPAGRGKKIQQSAVKKYADDHKLHTIQPTNLKDPAFIDELKALKADLQIVVAFRMLPDIVWKMPPLGTINLHASLLPDYRGAAPINWALINGEKETGISTFFIQQEIDTGNILFQKKVEISNSMSAGELHDILMIQGSELMINTIKAVTQGTIKAKNQQDILNGREPKLAPKIFKDDCRIAWNKTGNSINNLIRGLSPYPSAWSEIIFIDDSSVSIKIFEAIFKPQGHNLVTGQVSTDGKTFLEIACQDGLISITRLQLAGKNQMCISDFLRGFQSIDKIKKFI